MSINQCYIVDALIPQHLLHPHRRHSHHRHHRNRRHHHRLHHHCSPTFHSELNHFRLVTLHFLMISQAYSMVQRGYFLFRFLTPPTSSHIIVDLLLFSQLPRIASHWPHNSLPENVGLHAHLNLVPFDFLLGSMKSWFRACLRTVVNLSS